MWTPSEIRKLIAQIAGIAFGVGGFVLLVQGVQATGKINISSDFLSGGIESGSAGLFLLFLGFMLIALPTMVGNRLLPDWDTKKVVVSEQKPFSDFKRMALATITTGAISVVLLFGGEMLASRFQSQSGALVALGGALVGMIALGLLFISILEWTSSDVQKQRTPDEARKEGKSAF